MTCRFDAIIVGAGQAGPPLAGRLTAAGQSVALVERHLFGGTCVNTGCTPTKALVASARAAFVAASSQRWGIHVDGVRIDFAAVQQRQQAIAATSRAGLEGWLGAMEGLSIFRDHARFVAPHELNVGGEILGAERIFLNVGGRASWPKLPGIDTVPVLNNTSILQLQTLPDHLVIVGGSYIGLEFAQIFRRLGAQVTVVERANAIIAREDPDISAEITAILEAEGIAIRTGAECIRLIERNGGVGVGLDCLEGAPEVLGSHVLLAMGRQPNTDDLGLDKAGISTDPRGFIQVNDRLETSVPGIYALGDCNGRGAFTHTAYNDFEIVAANLLDGEQRTLGDRIAAYALFTDPPLGRVGLTATEAQRQGFEIAVGERPMSQVGRATEKGQTQGKMKVVVDRKTKAILGAAILGPGGDEAIHSLITAMAAGLTATEAQRIVPIHPTVAELVPTILGERRPL